jgi:uncharacterized protein
MSDYVDSLLREIADNEDGSFQIINRGGKAILIVNKPGKSGRSVTYKEVFSRLQVFGIENFDKARVESIVRTADGREYPIAEWKGGMSQDSTLEIEVSDDKMKAYIKITPPKNGGSLFTLSEIIKQLNDAGIVYGIKNDIIQDILKKQLFFLKSVVAEGTPSQHGKNGQIKILFELANKPDLPADERGRIDYKELGVIKTVKKEAKLAERLEAEPGKAGTNVLGEELPSPEGMKPVWRIGTNCKLSEDEKFLFSTIDGRPMMDKEGTIRVDEVCLLENVDYSTGNVDFPGTIIVEGTIADNFRLTTRGSLVIKKSVGRVFLFAEGDIVLSGGVMGRNGGLIESNNDIYAKFAEQANLKAGGSIFISEASMHSNLVAGVNIVLQGGRGELIGGEAIAGSYLFANKLGAVVETKTSIIVGIPPEKIDELGKLKADIDTKSIFLKKLKAALAKLTEKASKKEASQEEKDTINRISEAEADFTNKLKIALNQYEMLLSFDPSPDSFVEVEKLLYPKVNISFGSNRNFNSEIKSYDGKYYVYLNEASIPQISSVLPKTISKK